VAQEQFDRLWKCPQDTCAFFGQLNQRSSEKGKERKGKERKGKERKGKERLGNQKLTHPAVPEALGSVPERGTPGWERVGRAQNTGVAEVAVAAGVVAAVAEESAAEWAGSVPELAADPS